MPSETAEIRRFLKDTFSDLELAELCQDYFPEVYDNFAVGMSKAHKIQLLIDFCQRHDMLDDLLVALQKMRPKQFTQRFTDATTNEATSANSSIDLGKIEVPTSGDVEELPVPLGALLRYLHISDLHLTHQAKTGEIWSPDQFNQDMVTASMLDKIEQLVQAGKSLDMIIITGDLAKRGKPEEYEVAEAFCRQLLEKTGVPSNRLYIVPGNHDVDRSEVRKSHIKWWYSFADENEILEVLSDSASFSVIMGKFSAFYDFVERVTGHRWYNERNYYMFDSVPIHRQGQDFCINLVGLNSALFAGYDGDDRQKLALGLPQVTQALGQLEDDASLAIAFFHHPFSSFHPTDKVCQNLLMQKAELILTGHLHEPGNAFTRNAAGQAVVIGAGVSYEKRESENNSFNIVEIDLATGQGEAQFYKYLPDFHLWKENTDVNPGHPRGLFEFTIPIPGVSAR